jgi:CheY-like chemotaxis protein
VLQPEVLDLNSAIALTQKLIRRLIGEDIEMVFTPASGPALVRADRGQIGQIIMNLAINARDAMPHGGKFTVETVNVDFAEADSGPGLLARPGSYVMLVVKDTGTGMDEETRLRIFEPFFTTRDIGKGTGLGLSVVYGIVTQNGGFITVESNPGQGTEFRIWLPRVEQAPDSVLEVEATPVPGGVETILVVEDEPSLREKVAEVLAGAGYWVLVASGGEQASQVVRQYTAPIHLLLTDVVMPGISGPQLSEWLRRLRPEMKVLYMSGYPNPVDRGAVLESSHDFLQKPFTRQTLLRRVRGVLDSIVAAG